MRNPRRLWFSRHSERMWYWLGAGSGLVGGAWITYAVLRSSDYASVVLAVLWMLIAASWFFVALQRRRREQRGYDQVLPPVPAPEVLILAEQGRKIQAIKCYRELNPGIGLKEAKDVIDGL